MARIRSYSPLTREAAALLGARIQAARKERRWTLDELAERVGVTRPTIVKVERGDLSVGIGTVFEAAVLTGVTLFHDEPAGRARLSRETDLTLALLPEKIRRPRLDDDDF